VHHFHECAYLMRVSATDQNDRGGLEGQNVAINPCPPTKSDPLFCKPDGLSSLKDTSQKDDLGCLELLTFRTGGMTMLTLRQTSLSAWGIQ